MTYAELLAEVIARAFPEGYAENLLAIYQKRILAGLIEVQRWVPYIRDRQTRLYPFASTLYRQGTTVICKPEGKVKRVCTFNSKTLKDAVFYDVCSREDIDRLTAQRARIVPYPDAVPESFGYFNANLATDKGRRAERGLFCIDEKQIILLPQIESIERIMVEWKGSKTSFEDGDVVDYDKYQEQVIEALENWLRWKSVGKDDRSASDYVMLEAEWRASITGLQLDTKDDSEPEIPAEDIGILPRSIMPATVTPLSLACSYAPDDAFFKTLWMLCVANGKFYNLGALLLDDTVIEQVVGDGAVGGKAEVTYETIRVAKCNLNADDGNYYRLVPHIVNGEPTHGFDSDPVDTTDKVICPNVSCINLDILSPDDNQYYRLTLVLQDGVPVLNIDGAPAESETPVPTQSICTTGTTFLLKDSVTQKCLTVRIENGQFTISDE